MNLSEMRVKLRRRIGNPTVNAVTDVQLNDHINDAYTEIADRFRFHQVRKRCVFTTEDGRESYGIPTEATTILRVRDNTNGVKLEKFDDRRMAERRVADGELPTGFPIHYARYRDYLSLDPVPNGAYEIEVYYKRSMTNLLNDADVPVLPVVWHEGIVKLARFKYFEDVLDLPKARVAQDFWQNWLSDKPTELDEEKVDFDSGVSVPTLEQGLDRRQDFNTSL